MRTTRSKANRQRKLMQCIIKAPFRILSKARNFYMKSMEDCAGRVAYGGVVPYPGAAPASHLPKSFTVASSKASNEELMGLVRMASKRHRESKAESDMCQKQSAALGSNGGVGRSYSVGIGRIGRIDEDEPCEFVEEMDLLDPRSRSHAVRKRNVVYY